MRTDKQRETSKINGAKSHGPTTEAGKDASKNNATRHGLASDNPVILANEDPALFDYLRDVFFHRFQPIDGVEEDLVLRMVVASWKLRRIEAMECAMIDLEMHAQAPTVAKEFNWVDGSVRQFLAVKAISEQTSGTLLQRYVIRADRMYTNALRHLQLLQGDRFNNPGHPAAPGIPAPEPPVLEPEETAASEPAIAAEPQAINPRTFCRRVTEIRPEIAPEINKLQNEPEPFAFVVGASQFLSQEALNCAASSTPTS